MTYRGRGLFRAALLLVAVRFQGPLDQAVNWLKFDATGASFHWFNRRGVYFCIDLSDGNENLDARLQDCTSATAPGALFWVFNFHL